MDIFETKGKPGAGGGAEKTPRPVTAAAAKEVFAGCYDFETRVIRIGGSEGGTMATLCFIDGLVSGATVAQEVIRPLTDKWRFGEVRTTAGVIKMMMCGLTYSYTAKERTDMGDVESDLMNGFCAIIFDSVKKAVTFEVKSPDKRSIDAPKEEKVIKGSKDAFIEILKTNSTLVRRKLHDTHLKFKEVIVGTKTQTQAVIVYLEGFTNQEIVDEAEKRLRAIDVSGVLNTAAIEDGMVDNPRTPFPQFITTERPDKFCMNLLEGRVGILVDGLPVGFLAPGTFGQFFKVPEDCADHFVVATLLTALRYAALLLTLFLPAFYVAVAMYHQEMLPTKLIQSVIEVKQSVPFPTGFEVLAMLISFELLQEAGMRMSNAIGETISIIGALIVGQSAVEAKVVSQIVVVVVALAGIAGYTVPNQDMSNALRICRFFLVLAAVGMGLFGLVIGGILILGHLCALETFGVSYMTPFAGARGAHAFSAIVRKPMAHKGMAEPALKTGEKQETKKA